MKILKTRIQDGYNNATTEDRDAFARAIGALIQASYKDSVRVKVVIDGGPYARPPKIRVDAGDSKIYNMSITRATEK